MTKVAGQLIDVTASPSLVVSVWVRARRVRVRGGDVVTGEGAQVPVEDGRVSFTCLPGPAVLTLERAGVPAEVVPLVVPDTPEVSLGVCVEAARLADGGERSALERLAGEAAGAAESAGASASKAEEHAGEARSSADKAASSAASSRRAAVDAENSARQSRGSATNAGASASEAKASQDAARSSAEGAARSASAAKSSESQAKASADRADKIATSTSWSGDRLTVNGRTSPSLTGPKGDPGDASTLIAGDTWDQPPGSQDSGAVAVGRSAKAAGAGAVAVGRSAKATAFGAVAIGPGSVADKQNTVVLGASDAAVSVPSGRLSVGKKDVVSELEALSKDVASEILALRAELVSVRADLEAVRARPALWSGSGKPPSSIPGARTGDWWLDELSMDLYRITGV